jgi:hypothetical protein
LPAIAQETLTVAPGTSLEEVIRVGQTVYEPRCLVEGLRRVLDQEVVLGKSKSLSFSGVQLSILFLSYRTHGGISSEQDHRTKTD